MDGAFQALLSLPTPISQVHVVLDNASQSAAATVFFNLGEAVSAFGIIFAVYQLKSARWDSVLRIRGGFERNLVWYFGAAGLLMILLSTIVYELRLDWLPYPASSPVFFQLLGFALFALAPVALFRSATKMTGLFSQKRAERFYGILHAMLARSSEQSAEITVDIVSSNLERICGALSVAPKRRARAYPGHSSKAEAKALTDAEKFTGYADAVLTVILGDSRVANYVAVGRLDFLFRLFHYLKSNNISSSQTKPGIERLVEALYENPNSHLYSQLDWRGLSLSANVYSLLFSDAYVLETFSPFRTARAWGTLSEFTAAYLDVFLKALEYASKGFWRRHCPLEMVDEICYGFKVLEQYCLVFSFAATDTISSKEALERLRTVGDFLGHTYVWAYRDALEKNLITDYEKDAAKNSDVQYSVNYAYAKAVYALLECLSRVSVDDSETMRIEAIQATTELIGVTVKPGHDLASISDALIKLIWEKIEDDEMSNINGWFPAILKTYLALVGLGVETASVAAQERRRVIGFLYNKLMPKILVNEKMHDGRTTFESALLPEQVIFDRRKRVFRYKTGSGGFQDMNRIEGN